MQKNNTQNNEAIFKLDKYAIEVRSNLSQDQLLCLDQLKSYVYKIKKMNQPLYDDWFLIRFCKRKNWKIKDTQDLFEEYIQFREKKDLDNILKYDLSAYEAVHKKYYHCWYSGIDKKGRPINIERIKYFDAKLLARIVEVEDTISFFARTSEILIHCILPICSRMAGKRIDRNFTIIDLDGVQISAFIFDSKVIAFLKAFVNTVQEFYPAQCDQIFIINAPSIFNVLWKVVKIWLAEKTRNKIKIFKKGWEKDLYQICDKSQLPKFLGGYQNDFPEQDKAPWSDYLEHCYRQGTFFGTPEEFVGDPLKAADMKQFNVQIPLEKKTRQGIETNNKKEKKSSRNLGLGFKALQKSSRNLRKNEPNTENLGFQNPKNKSKVEYNTISTLSNNEGHPGLSEIFYELLDIRFLILNIIVYFVQELILLMPDYLNIIMNELWNLVW